MPDFNFYFEIILDERNAELCNEVWSSLPFAYVMEHAWVSGHSMYGWVPMISTAPIYYKIPRSEASVGMVSFNQGTGNKISIKYGEITEDLPANVLGQIPEKYLKRLAEVGREVWFNYFSDKKIYTVRMSQCQ